MEDVFNFENFLFRSEYNLNNNFNNKQFTDKTQTICEGIVDSLNSKESNLISFTSDIFIAIFKYYRSGRNLRLLLIDEPKEYINIYSEYKLKENGDQFLLNSIEDPMLIHIHNMSSSFIYSELNINRYASYKKDKEVLVNKSAYDRSVILSGENLFLILSLLIGFIKIPNVEFMNKTLDNLAENILLDNEDVNKHGNNLTDIKKRTIKKFLEVIKKQFVDNIFFNCENNVNSFIEKLKLFRNNFKKYNSKISTDIMDTVIYFYFFPYSGANKVYDCDGIINIETINYNFCYVNHINNIISEDFILFLSKLKDKFVKYKYNEKTNLYWSN